MCTSSARCLAAVGGRGLEGPRFPASAGLAVSAETGRAGPAVAGPRAGTAAEPLGH